MIDLLREIPPPDPIELGAFLRQVWEEEAGPQPRAIGPCTRYTDRDGKVTCWHSKDDYDWWIVKSGSGFRLTSIQGSYTTSNPDSANTHAKGGVKDIELDGYSKTECIRQCKLARDRGLLAWPRFWTGNWHAHVIDPMCPNMAPELAAQVVLFGKGYDGLVGNNPDPLGGYGKTLIMGLYANRAATVIVPPPTALATTTVLTELTRPLSKGAYARTSAKTSQGGTAYAAGTHVYEYQPAGTTTWKPFHQEAVVNGVSSFLWNYGGPQLIRVRFVPKSATVSLPSTSSPVSPRVVDLGAVETQVANLTAQNRTLVNENGALKGQVATLTAENADLKQRLASGGSNPPEPVPAFGFDVSGYQTVDQVRELAADPKNLFGIVKATQRANYTSNGWPALKDALGDLFIGSYHYAEPPRDPVAEANWYLSVAGSTPGLLAYDVEAFGTLVGDKWTARDVKANPLTTTEERQLAVTTLGWLRHVKQVDGRSALVYTNWAWLPALRRGLTVAEWDELVDGWPLWLAEVKPPGQHSTVDPKPGSTKGWTNIVLHQYAYTPLGNNEIDRDWTPDLARLLSYGKKP